MLLEDEYSDYVLRQLKIPLPQNSDCYALELRIPYKLTRVGSALAVLGGHVQHRTREGVARNTLEI